MRLSSQKQKFLFTSQKDEYCKMVYKNTELYLNCRIIIDKLTELWVLNGMPKKVPEKILNLSYKTYYELSNNWYDSTYPLIDVPSWILQNYLSFLVELSVMLDKIITHFRSERGRHGSAWADTWAKRSHGYQEGF